MLNYDTFVKESVSFDLTLSKLAKKVQVEILKAISQSKSEKEIRNIIYKLLTKEGFDATAFDYIYSAVNKTSPIPKAKYAKEFINRDIDGTKFNLYDNIDNKASTDRLTTRLSKDLGVLEDRKHRLSLYKVPSDRASWDLKRSISTIKTDANNLKSQSVELTKKTRKIKDPKVLAEARKQRDIITAEYKATRQIHLDLAKKYTAYERITDETAKKRAMKALVKDVTKDIDKRKIPASISQAVSSSIGEPVKTVAITEVQTANRNIALKKIDTMKSTLKKGEKIFVKITLSPNRTFVGPDICDVITGKDLGYGKGVYPLNKAKLPPYHPRCACNHTIIKKKV